LLEACLQVWEGRLVQREEDFLFGSNLPPNVKLRFITTLHQLRDKPARDVVVQCKSERTTISLSEELPSFPGPLFAFITGNFTLGQPKANGKFVLATANY